MARGKTTPKAARRKSRKLKGRIAAKKKKEFVYRGKTLEELQAMSIEEFTELLPSRARRTITRGLQSKNPKFFRHLERGDEVIKTHSREIVILPEMVNRKLAIHDGKQFLEVTVTPEMIGHMTGEFALTRKQTKHTGVGVGATRSSKYMPLK
ncbi:MAG: 30S ribosomal protein S19 [Candidatus Thermoplasmatota archaeon]|nr:30S ribosomal protein S19 [Candidatus Thermoplasmatota archaeon]